MGTLYIVQTPDSVILDMLPSYGAALSLARRDGCRYNRDTAVYEKREGRPVRRRWSYLREGRGRRPRG